MSFFVAAGISIGILAGVWAQWCVDIGLITWIGFLSWACFYAAGGKKEGLFKAVCSNLSGVLWGVAMVYAIGLMGSFPLATGVAVMIGAFFLCAQAHISFLAFIPGSFVGCASFFGAGASYDGVWSVVGSLVCGAVLGFISEVIANKLTKMFPSKAS